MLLSQAHGKPAMHKAQLEVHISSPTPMARCFVQRLMAGNAQTHCDTRFSNARGQACPKSNCLARLHAYDSSPLSESFTCAWTTKSVSNWCKSIYARKAGLRHSPAAKTIHKAAPCKNQTCHTDKTTHCNAQDPRDVNLLRVLVACHGFDKTPPFDTGQR